VNSASLNSPLTLTDSEQRRISKVQAVADQGSSGISELLGMLTDPSWVVRRAVVNAFSNLGESSVKTLCDFLKNHRESEAGIAATVDALVMSAIPGEKFILELAEDPSPAIVADVVQIVGRRRSQSSIPVLIKLTKHQDDNVAVGAIEALGRIGGRAAVEALIETVGTGNFFRTFPAIDVLGRSSDPRAVEPLVKLLANPTYLPEAARALGRSGEKAAVRPLLGLMRSPSDAVIRIAASSVWELRERYEQMSGDDGVLIDGIIRAGSGEKTHSCFIECRRFRRCCSL
jgi:HEAT repeat protein